MICPDCATGADIATNTTGATPAAAAWAAGIANEAHERCRARNLGREYGQSADCTCQHTTPAATATYARS